MLREKPFKPVDAALDRAFPEYKLSLQDYSMFGDLVFLERKNLTLIWEHTPTPITAQVIATSVLQEIKRSKNQYFTLKDMLRLDKEVIQYVERSMPNIELFDEVLHLQRAVSFLKEEASS